MLFSDLVVCNKEWSESTQLIIISQSDTDAASMSAKSARSIFADRQVLWFKDEVVMIL